MNTSKRDFIAFMARGEKQQLFNEHDYPLAELIHPLIHAEDPRHHSDVLKIPMGYQFQRKYKEFVFSLLKE